jgi:hypothetical protein
MYAQLVPPADRSTYDHNGKRARPNGFGLQAASMGLVLVPLVLLSALSIVFTITATVPSASASPVHGACLATVTPEPQESAVVKEASLTIDRVDLHISTTFLPVWGSTSSPFTTSSSGDATQGASASAPCPWRILTITAVPFGTTPPVEAVPLAHHGGAGEYLAAMRAYDKANELLYEPNGPVASLFNQKARSQVKLMRSYVLSTGPKPVPLLVVEWVVEAGPRLWIMRVERELPPGTTDLNSQQPFLRSLERLVLSSNNLNNPTTLSTPIADPGIPPTGIRSPATGGPSIPDAIVVVVTLIGGLLLVGGLVIRRTSCRP